MDQYEILIIAKNKDGIIGRILSLFNKRGYFVRKMTAGATNRAGYARLTLTVEGDELTLEQIQKQVYKIIDVVKVKIFPSKGVIRREMMLIKVKASNETRTQIIQIADIYRGSVLDVSSSSLTILLTGDEKKLDGFVEMMKSYEILEIAKTGILAMSRGEKM
ncbi:MAG: acetolactate synthase small subunit [Tissierellia bacterium]|nr:acetolactate synthase small subunit [Tissierellia bacterium]